MKQSTFNEIIDKLNAGKTVYLLNEFYNRAIKIPSEGLIYTAKKKGGGEYPIKRNTDLVCETMTEAIEITEKEYLEY